MLVMSRKSISKAGTPTVDADLDSRINAPHASYQADTKRPGIFRAVKVFVHPIFKLLWHSITS